MSLYTTHAHATPHVRASPGLSCLAVLQAHLLSLQPRAGDPSAPTVVRLQNLWQPVVDSDETVTSPSLGALLVAPRGVSSVSERSLTVVRSLEDVQASRLQVRFLATPLPQSVPQQGVRSCVAVTIIFPYSGSGWPPGDDDGCRDTVLQWISSGMTPPPETAPVSDATTDVQLAPQQIRTFLVQCVAWSLLCLVCLPASLCA